MLPYNIHHVAIAVNDLDASIASFAEKYRLEVLSRERIEEQGVEEAMIACGGSHIQLLQPLDAMSPVGRFLSRNGEGMHHIAFAVVDITRVRVVPGLREFRVRFAAIIPGRPGDLCVFG